MSPAEVASIVFACVFGGALLGMLLRGIVPEAHLDESAKEVIKLGMGLVATMAALVLGLMTATAKNSYDTQDAAVKHSAAKILLLDHVLSSYGPETKETRDALRALIARRLGEIWPEDPTKRPLVLAPDAVLVGQAISSRLLQLSPQTATQHWLKSQALQIGSDITEMRWLIQGSLGRSVPTSFLVVLVFWLTIIFASFGLLAPRNATVVAILFLCALSVAGAVLLILEMDEPFDGLMQISSAPLRHALSHLGE